MTYADFKRLPLVLKPRHVYWVLGLGPDAMKALRESNPEIVVRKCGRGTHLYSKSAIAKLAKLPYE